MSRIPTIEKNAAEPSIAPLYEAVEKKLGLIPNMVKALGHSAASLQAYLGVSGAVSSGKLRPSTREKIALLVAEANACDYCLSAHTAIGGLLKIPAPELEAARHGQSPDAKEQAILALARSIIDTRGAVPDGVFRQAIEAGVSTGEAVEVLANVAENIFTNYFNRFAQTEIDFPKVHACTSGCCLTH